MNLATASKSVILFSALIFLIAISPRSAEAHNGGVVIQLQDNKIVVGHHDEVPGIPIDMTARVYSSLFRPELYGQDIPSFLTISDPPSGTSRLPAGANVYWDFLPMNVNGVTSNLLYWNGQGTTVESVSFGPVPQANVTMSLYNVADGGFGLVSGTPDMVAGNLLGIVDSPGDPLEMHRHNFFILDDGDGGIPPTTVPEGIYLIAMQLRMDDYWTSDPFYIVPGTFGIIGQSLDPLNAAMAWVEQNTKTLIRDGDYDFDGDVDTADHATWTRQYGYSGAWPISGDGDFADGNRDSIVDAADYVVYRKFSAASGGSPGAASAAVPEPSAALIFGCIAAMVALRRRRGRW